MKKFFNEWAYNLNKMKILHLTLKKKWFDKTYSGEKPDEYRDITPYWVSRLVDWSRYPKESKDDHKYITENIVYDIEQGHNPYDVLKSYFSDLKEFDNVIATNGYGKHRPSWNRKFLGIEIREGRKEWGAEPGKKYFVIKLGERIN